MRVFRESTKLDPLVEQLLAAVDYRIPAPSSDYILKQALPLLGAALKKHTKLTADIIDLTVNKPSPLVLAKNRGGDLTVTLLSTLVIFSCKARESDRVWALTYMLGDERQQVRRTAACCLCHIGTASALIAVLDNEPYKSGVCRRVLQIISESIPPLYEVAPALSRLCRREDVYYKHGYVATKVLAEMGQPVLQQIRELLEEPNAWGKANGLQAVTMLGKQARPLRKIIAKMVNDDEKEIRELSAEALKKLDAE